jgi:hypothetical protein
VTNVCRRVSGIPQLDVLTTCAFLAKSETLFDLPCVLLLRNIDRDHRRLANGEFKLGLVLLDPLERIANGSIRLDGKVFPHRLDILELLAAALVSSAARN